jgi:hypothetical protein
MAWGTGGFTLALVGLLSATVGAKKIVCPAVDPASLQACIYTAHTNNPVGLDTVSDTIVVTVAPGLYHLASQIRINNRKNLWIIGDTTATETNQPRILYQDTVHTYTDLDVAKRTDTSAAGTYGQNNGTVWIYMSSNVVLMGLLIDGNGFTGTTNAKGRIFAYGATLGLGKTDEVRGNVGVNVLMSHAVQLRYLSVTNAWDGIAIVSPNLGGAFSYPDPNDPPSEVTATLPTSQAGLYGSHLVERCRIHDNTFGILCQRDWDLSSVFRNNLFWGNYLRHWADPRTPGSTGAACPTNEYITHLCEVDTAVHADGSRRSLAFTTVGGAFLMTDVALTPYRIHNNTFFDNATTVSGYYKTGTQHLFYNNLVGKPYQSFRGAISLPVQAGSVNGAPWSPNYTQTERQSEMLQYFAEHQRSNRVVDQDSIPPLGNQGAVPNYFGPGGGNLRLFNMRMIHLANGSWPGRSWSNDANDQDSLGMTWVPSLTAVGSMGAIADSGGIVNYIRQNMWVGAAPDPSIDNTPGNNSPFNNHLPDAANGSRWSPPWLPNNIQASLADGTIFRNTGTFDVRWTFGLPIDTTLPTAPTWLQPKALDAVQTTAKFLTGWPTYEGTATNSTEAVKVPLAIGAYAPGGGWAAPARRLILHDTLITSVNDSMVQFNLNVAGLGIANADIDSLEVSSAKFYNNVPVSDTLYNQGVPKTGPFAGVANRTTTRENSILSSTPWPLPYQFLRADYDPTGFGQFNVDDSLTKNLLSPNNTFIGKIGAGYRLNGDSLYARAEVVLKAYMKDGTVIYSNPAVFMFSRPRFQFTVTVTDANGNPLPHDPDGISLDVVAGQPLHVSVKAKLVGTIPVPFQGYANLTIGNLGTLVGADGNQLDKLPGQNLVGTNFAPVHANDIIDASFLKNDSVVGLYHAMASPSNGTLTYTAVFQASDLSLLSYFIQGKSSPLKVVSGSIYQVTVDSVYRKTDTALLASPSEAIKLAISTRDTILKSPTDTSTSRNVSDVYQGDTLRVVMQVRDRYGNPVEGADSTSAKKGLYIKLAHDLVPGRYPNVTTNANLLGIDTLGGATWPDSIRISFDSTGRATAYVVVSGAATKAALAGLRASLIDSFGVEIGTALSARDSGIADTTWLSLQPVALGVAWVDTLTKKELAPITGYVGSWYPVLLETTNNGLPSPFTGTLPITAFSALHFHPSMGDTTTVTSAVFNGTAYSQVLWVRANDSTSVGWIQTNSAQGSDSVAPLKFTYPQPVGAVFYDANCDGKVDSLSVKFNGPLDFRASSGVVAGDKLDLIFPHQFLSPSAMGAPLRVTVIGDSTLGFAWDPGTTGTADASANQIVVGNPLSATAITFKLATLADKAPPIALRATDVQTWANSGPQDSLVVWFSEDIDVSQFVTGSALPFVIERSGATVPLTGATLTRAVQALDSGEYSFVFTAPTTLVLPTDSLRISGTSISDLAGNMSGTACPDQPFQVLVTPRFTPLPGYVLDVNGDGNADSVHLSFKDSLGTLPNSIFIEWGTPAETLTVVKAQLVAWGVKTSDSVIDVPVTTWHGQTVVIDGDTVHNAPRTVGELDTAIFNGVVGATLRDRVPPVLLYAKLKYGPSVQVGQQGYDTLDVDFSEAVSGCATGTSASVCLSEKQTSSSGYPFPSGSKILTTDNSGAGWILLVPQGSIHVGDSARATPAVQSGMLADMSANNPGPASPWVYVLGDPPPPNHGWMMDLNGDGRVDHVLLSFLNPPTVAKLPDYQFEWGNAAGAAITLTSDSAYPIDSTHLLWMAVLATPGDFGATGYPPATQKMLGLQPTSTPYRFWVSDSTGPVLKPPATLKPSPDSLGADTLIVTPSEFLASPTNSVLLEFKRGGQAIPADSVLFLSAKPSANGTWTVILAPNSPYRPNPGDSVRLSTSGSVVDSTSSRNVPSPNEPWVVLTGNLRVPYASYYYDRDVDGRVDSVSLSFAAPPVVGTVVRVADPAGSGTYKSFTIPAADAGLKVVSFGFDTSEWGQNVTGWSNTNLGTLLPVAGADTAIHGGPFSILDRVPPVIVSAVLRYTSDTSSVDTLKVVFSENVKLDLAQILSQFKHPGSSSDTGTSVLPIAIKYDSATKVLTVYLRPVPTGDTLNPGVGDSLRLTFAVQDLAGNAPQTVAKWTVVTGNRRVFPPIVTLSNPIITNGNHAGDPVEDPTTGKPQITLPIVVRPSEPGNTGDWQVLGSDGKLSPAGTSYKPGQSDYSAAGSQGTVVFVQTNVPLNLTLYIYDNVGTYVTSVSKDITQALLDQAEQAMAQSGTLLSKVGMVDIGILWKGQDADGKQVASGIYPTRLIAYRNPTPEEKADGQVSPLMYNHLVRIGVHLKTN